MKLLPELIDKEAHKEFRRFLENTGHTNWEEKIKKLNSLPRFRAPSPNVYLEYLANRNPLAKHIEIYLTLEREGKSLRKPASPALMKACGVTSGRKCDISRKRSQYSREIEVDSIR